MNHNPVTPAAREAAGKEVAENRELGAKPAPLGIYVQVLLSDRDAEIERLRKGLERARCRVQEFHNTCVHIGVPGVQSSLDEIDALLTPPSPSAGTEEWRMLEPQKDKLKIGDQARADEPGKWVDVPAHWEGDEVFFPDAFRRRKPAQQG